MLTLVSMSSISASQSVPSIPGTALTLEEAQEEIHLLENLTLTLCDKEKEEFLGGRGVYIIRLACSLAKRMHNCACVPRQEHIPVINDETIAKFNNYSPCEKFTEEMKMVNDKLGEGLNRPSIQSKFNQRPSDKKQDIVGFML